MSNQPTTAEKVRTIIDELSSEFFERREHIEAIWIGILSGEHTFLLGPPGTAKSLLVRSVCGRITGAKYWETLLDRQLPMESIFGPIDLKEFEQTGNWHRRVDGYAPTANIAFLDEVGKAGPAVLNPMLTWLMERLYHNNSTPMVCPLLSAVGASNEELEEELAAMWDRWLLRLIVEPIQEPKNLAALLASAQVGQGSHTEVTMAEVEQAAGTEVPSVRLPSGVIETVIQLRNELREEQVQPSDRRWKKSMRLLQAHAWLHGRGAVEEDDLAILRHSLWDVVEQIPIVEKKTLRLTSELTRQALEFQAQLEDIESGIDARRGESMEKRAAYGGEAKHKVDTIQRKVSELIEKGHRQGRSTTKLEQVLEQVRAIKTRIFVECLNVPQDRAEKMGG